MRDTGRRGDYRCKDSKVGGAIVLMMIALRYNIVNGRTEKECFINFVVELFIVSDSVGPTMVQIELYLLAIAPVLGA